LTKAEKTLYISNSCLSTNGPKTTRNTSIKLWVRETPK